MTTAVAALPTLDDLTAYVRTALCEPDRLDPAQTPYFRSPVVRNGRPWGYLFHVEGPRLLNLSAIWAADADTLTFYDTQGTKVKEVRLTVAPVLPDIRSVGVPARVTNPRRKSA